MTNRDDIITTVCDDPEDDVRHVVEVTASRDIMKTTINWRLKDIVRGRTKHDVEDSLAGFVNNMYDEVPA